MRQNEVVTSMQVAGVAIPRKRAVATAEERKERHQADVRRRQKTARSDEDAVDAMIRHSIETHGA